MQTVNILLKTQPRLACLAQTNDAITYAYTTHPSSTGVYYNRITAVEEDGQNKGRHPHYQR